MTDKTTPIGLPEGRESEIRAELHAAIVAPDDWEWAHARVRLMYASAYVNARRLGKKLLKGFGYPDEIFGSAQDARALGTLLARVDTLRQQVETDKLVRHRQMNEILALKDEIAALTEAQARVTWQPIETAPRDGTPILLWFNKNGPEGGAHRARWSTHSELWWMEGHHCGGQLSSAWEPPTHWMPIPAPPASAPPETKNDELTRRDTSGSQPPRSAASTDTKGSEQA